MKSLNNGRKKFYNIGHRSLVKTISKVIFVQLKKMRKFWLLLTAIKVAQIDVSAQLNLVSILPRFLDEAIALYYMAW
jgi:hypothetical protein